jgi:hypothetical protein
MAVDELSTSYHPTPAYFDDAAPHLQSNAINLRIPPEPRTLQFREF